MKTTLIALAAAGVLASGTASATPGEDVTLLMTAQYHDDRGDDHSLSINEREQRINERIQGAMEAGRITEHEARRLDRELNGIEAKERSFLYDGHLSRKETDELHRDLDRLRDRVPQAVRDEPRY